MKASDIIDQEMTLDEKLAAIDKAVQDLSNKAKEKARSLGITYVPEDPDSLLQCDGCS